LIKAGENTKQYENDFYELLILFGNAGIGNLRASIPIKFDFWCFSKNS